MEWPYNRNKTYGKPWFDGGCQTAKQKCIGMKRSTAKFNKSNRAYRKLCEKRSLQHELDRLMLQARQMLGNTDEYSPPDPMKNGVHMMEITNEGVEMAI